MIVGVYGGLAGLAVAIGPIVGGAVTQGIDWHWIFWINVPIGAVALPLAMRLLPDSQGAPERLDLPGVTLVTGGVVAIVWALVRANQTGWASAEIVSCLVSGAVLLLAFAAWEQRVSEPMVPLRLFRSRAFAAGNATTFLMTGAIFAAGFKPALAACAGFALLAALSALAITPPRTQNAPALAEGGSPARPEPATADAVEYRP
jgi:MFS family permease